MATIIPSAIITEKAIWNTSSGSVMLDRRWLARMVIFDCPVFSILKFLLNFVCVYSTAKRCDGSLCIPHRGYPLCIQLYRVQHTQCHWLGNWKKNVDKCWKYAFTEGGRGVWKKSTVCTLVIMSTIMNDPLAGWAKHYNYACRLLSIMLRGVQ